MAVNSADLAVGNTGDRFNLELQASSAIKEQIQAAASVRYNRNRVPSNRF